VEQNRMVTAMVTCQRLMRIAECSCRMTEYADPGGSRLITIINGQDGTSIRLVLEPECILNNCEKFGLHRACRHSIFRALYESIGNITPKKDVIACLELENLQRSTKKK
jgi:hypothetical protein